MAFEDNGNGIPLLLIHGYPLNRILWAPQLHGLADVARVLAPDLRGHGDSQVMPGVYWMELLAGDLNAFLDALEITDPVVICGLSMGGYIALAFHRKYASRMAGLILTATRAGADSPEGKAGRDQAAQTAQEKGLSAIADAMLPKMLSPKTYEQRPELVNRVRTIMEDNSLEAILGDLEGMKERPDSTPALQEIHLPTLILHGADDQIIPVKEAEAMRDAIPNARLQLIPDAGHLLNLEQPDLFNQAVRSFLQSIQSRK
jgi:pimeloyl-ACP methyl ester carboxylesterase